MIFGMSAAPGRPTNAPQSSLTMEIRFPWRQLQNSVASISNPNANSVRSITARPRRVGHPVATDMASHQLSLTFPQISQWLAILLAAQNRLLPIAPKANARKKPHRHRLELRPPRLRRAKHNRPNNHQQNQVPNLQFRRNRIPPKKRLTLTSLNAKRASPPPTPAAPIPRVAWIPRTKTC